MKYIKTTIILFISTISILNAQEVHWKSLNEESKHIASLYFGGDYSIYYGTSYGYIQKNKILPLVIGTELTIPFGNRILDDWKLKTSIQGEIWKFNNLSLALKPSFIVRRYESEIAKLHNIGFDFSTLFGYSKPKWGITSILNYDRSISTHINNTLLKEYYPSIKNGWYNSAGGNFKFGIRTNLAIKSWNSFFTIGKSYGQDFKHNPTLPFYFDLSLQKQF